MFAQKNNLTTIHFKDGTSKQYEKLKFEYNTENYVIGIEVTTNSDKKTKINISDILNAQEDNSHYVTKQYNKNVYLFEELILGSLSLYRSGDHFFLDNEAYGFREIEKKVVNDVTLNTFNYGTLTIYINKCQAAQEEGYNKHDSITLSNLIAIIETYNSCDLSEDTQFATNVITQANNPKEFVEFAVNVGYNLLNTDFNDLSPGVSNSFGTPVIGAQVYFNNNMLNGSLGFIAMVDYSFPQEFNSSSNDIFLNTKTSYVLTMLGVRYSFNNISKTFRPYFGFNGGFLFNSMSSVTKQSNIYGSTVYNFDTTNELAYNLNAGTYIKFGKQKLDFNVMYLPKLDFGLIALANLRSISNNYTVSGFQLKVSYIF
ncbi:hypothetical protein GCM10010976_30950 [Bizionia arctica]|uniref:Uncharacterized protein n=2 Tax=Bizionia arctica TaxID=1495645 RepID=A0A917GUP7_9FLAO|nr:hypothetical protein GCM10010976_30950 [Bizionia arctica]